MKHSFVFGILFLFLVAPFALADSAGSVSVCKGENAVFEFELYNQAEPLTYAITPSGMTGTLSATSLSLGRGETGNFSFLVATVNRAVGSYPFTIVADNGVSSSSASGLLVVLNCYDSVLSLNQTAVTVERCNSAKVKVSLQNTGSKQDAFSLSSSGDLPAAFSPTALSVGPSSQASADAVVSVPCATSAGTHTLQINSSGHSKQSAKLTVYVTAPTPTPTPKGCAYSNPACASPKVCQNNTCVLPSGCRYNNPACSAGFSCNGTANSCTEIPKEPPVVTTAVRTCKGDVARFKFSVYNPESAQAVFNVTATSGLNGTLSAKSLPVPGNSSENVYYTVNTSNVAAGSYPIAFVASNGRTSGSAASQLQVEDCFASNLTLVSAAPTAAATTAPAANASAVPSVAPTASVNASANSTNATSKPAGVLWVMLPQGIQLESGLQKNITVAVRNAADYDVSSVRILISNMTVSDAVIPSVPAGKTLNVDLVVSTGLSRPFNATVRAIGQQGSGEAVLFVNATEGLVAAKASGSSASAVNGTNGSVELVNTTVRLYNYANATSNLSVAVREPSVNVSTAEVSIPAKSYVEITLLTQVQKGKDLNATLLVGAGNGTTYSLPVSLRAVTPSASTGLFSGGLVSMFSLAIVAIGVILVLFYFARKKSGDEEGEDGSGQEDDEDSEGEDEPEGQKKPAKKKR